jgi:hypothetical protein
VLEALVVAGRGGSLVGSLHLVALLQSVPVLKSLFLWELLVGLVGRNICAGTSGSGIRVVDGSRGGGGRVVGGKWDPPFLLLLYVNHCKCGAAEWHGGLSGTGVEGEHQERNSGVDRGMVESLPVFQFGALHGQKAGLVCAVCLSWFDGINTTAPVKRRRNQPRRARNRPPLPAGRRGKRCRGR